MNITNELKKVALEYPTKTALRFPKRKLFGGYHYQEMSFETLYDYVDKYAASFTKMGITRGTKTILFVKPCLEFTALVFALFKVGAIPVLIDPGMGRENLLKAVKSVQPEALIAVPVVHLLRFFFRDAFSSIKHSVTTGSFKFGAQKKASSFLKKCLTSTEICQLDESETAAILFTSGGTGTPKGVLYTHKIFQTQTKILKELFSLSPKEVDLPGFPLFSLFTVTMGMTSCSPDMNPAKPAKANPKRLVQNIMDNKATFVAGSPAIWERVADYCLKHSITLPSIKYLVMFGAPVSNKLHQKFKPVLTGGTTYTPYGATESLPVANISGKYVLENTAKITDEGKGTCVGMPVPSIKVKIIDVTDDAIESLGNTNEKNVGEIGEIIVSGDVVTREYFGLEQATKEAKIYDNNSNELWHRIGDLGYLDEQGYLWFCGRKTHRVDLKDSTLCSVQCEAIFNHHPKVKRTALVGPVDSSMNVIPTILIETSKDLAKSEKNELIKELMSMGEKYSHTSAIKKFDFYSQFPVDVRHNIKIDRLKLRTVAQQRIDQGMLL